MFNKNKKISDFENATTKAHKIHYSRYIASWIDVYMKTYLRNLEFEKSEEDYMHKYIAYSRGGIFGIQFTEWLRSMDLTEDEIEHILWIAHNGKMELECSARAFISQNN